MMAEHLRLEVGDVIHLAQTNDLSPTLLAGDCLYRRVIGFQRGEYITQGFMPNHGEDEGYELLDDIRPLDQAFVDRFAKKLVSGPREEQVG